jgi:hypothetical protein
MSRPRIYTTPEAAQAARAESSRRVRAARRDAGLTYVTAWVSPEAVAGLFTLMDRHGCTAERAVGIALEGERHE